LKKFLYLILACVLFNQSSAQKLKKLGIEFTSMTYNFGDVPMWENQPAIYTLTNNSKHSISILPLFSENDLEIIYPEKAIKPGEKAIIKAIYYTSGTGSFSRKFPIYFNASPEAYELKVTGNIKNLSPTAYIQCPMAKPEHSKPKVELFGKVAEIETQIPLSGSTIRIIGLTNKIDLTFFADRMGDFGSKLPVGNYEVLVDHPRYQSYQSMFYLGQQTGYLKISLIPLVEEPVLAQANIPIDKEQLERKDADLNKELDKGQANKVETTITKPPTPKPDLDKFIIDTKESKPLNPINSRPVPQIETPVALAVEEETISPIESEQVPVENTPTNSLPNNVPSSRSPIIEILEPVPEPIQLKEYTIRVIDELALDPIEDAEIFITPILNKKKTRKSKSDESGMASLQLGKEDYKLIVNADHYISGEAIIRADQDDEVIRIFLSPVSNLFEEIYAAKKEESNPNELLSQLSFGTTEFSFASEEDEEAEEVLEVIPSAPLALAVIEEAPIREAIELETEEEVIVVIPVTNTERTAEPIVEVIEEPIVTPPLPKPTLNLDSIQTYLAELQAENEALEFSLAQAAIALNKKEDLIAQRESELETKDLALDEKSNELAEAKEELKQIETEDLARLEESIPALVEEDEVLSIDDYAANNVLFLIDVSSSMAKENKMDLLKESLKSLALVLRDIDRVAIIAYNQKTNVILESVSGDNKSTILHAIDSLKTSGLTYGVNGLQTAYDLLQYYFIGDGNNQIILATDGLFSSANASLTENELNKEVRKQASNNGIKLSVIGFGQDDEGQRLMQKLANNGEGQFIQIKNPWEAKTVLVEEIKLNSKR
jgi:Mg-chelatase subunit ChlD